MVPCRAFSLSRMVSLTVLAIATLVACGGGGEASNTVTFVPDVSITPPDTSPNIKVADLVTNVATPVYTGAYAQEKAAVFNLLNEDRAKCGFGKLAQNTKIDTAAQGHATYQAINVDVTHIQNPNLPGFTGVSFSDRFTAAGYASATGTEVTNSLMWGPGAAGNSTYHAVSITELAATHSLKYFYASVYHLWGAMTLYREVGIGIDSRLTTVGGNLNMKPLVINTAIASGSIVQAIGDKGIATFPCDGIAGLHPIFAPELPNPFPGVDMNLTPYGHPVYVLSGVGTTLALTSGSITLRGGAVVPTTTLTADNDPQQWLGTNQVFLVPTTRLADNSTYDVVLEGTSSGLVGTDNPQGHWSRSFSFTTATLQSE